MSSTPPWPTNHRRGHERVTHSTKPQDRDFIRQPREHQCKEVDGESRGPNEAGGNSVPQETHSTVWAILISYTGKEWGEA